MSPGLYLVAGAGAREQFFAAIEWFIDEARA
jgi:hypothetical protein